MQRPRRRVIFLTFYDLDNLGLDNARPVRQFAPSSSSSSQVVTVEAVSLVQNIRAAAAKSWFPRRSRGPYLLLELASHVCVERKISSACFLQPWPSFA